MKIDIKAIAKEAGAVEMRENCLQSEAFPWGVEMELPALERFAALVLEKVAQVCEGMHEEDRPGDYADAVRSMAAGMGG